ncbi:MAG: polysaccharide deacetylase family protein [Bacteroidales bacterium]
MRFVSPPRLLRLLSPSDLIWSFPQEPKRIFLTFDDGPHPEITPAIMDILRSFDARATFFCLGKNAAAFPEIVKDLTNQGHQVGNHTFSHLNGWKTPAEIYVKDYQQAGLFLPGGLFRPPYGKITPAQVRLLKNHERIIMWSLLSYDFDRTFSEKTILHNLIARMHHGAIIVFHDNEKSAPRCLKVLPQLLDYYKQLGYEFCNIKKLDMFAERA